MRIASAIAFGLFVLAAAVQLNDPDPGIWIAAYGIAAATAVGAFFGAVRLPVTGILTVLYVAAAWRSFPHATDGASLGVSDFGMSSLGVEEMREALGLGLCAAWTAFLSARAALGPSARSVGVAVAAFLVVGCAGTVPNRFYPLDDHVVAVPEAIDRRILPRARVATDLQNPRGMLLRDDGEMLVSVAGTGDPGDAPSGALIALVDGNGDGVYEGRRVLLDGQASRNIIDIVRRDEVFGMAGIAEGGGATLVSLAYFGGPSTIFRVDGDDVAEWGRVFGNINDVAYDPEQKSWVGVSSSSDEIVRLQPERGSQRILKVPPLPEGQDPVPGYLRHDPETEDLLVTLFSGSTEGEEGGKGIELLRGAGGIVRVDPVTGDLRWLVTGLTAPTDLEIGPDGRLYVLEFCSHFEDPVEGREAMWEAPTHGGFRRFSGRLLAIERESGEVTVVADGLDGPTNLALDGRDLYIAQGMGTPGRPIPGPDGTVPLTGFIERVELPAAGEGA